MTDRTIADIVADMAASTTRNDRDWKKTQAAATKQRLAEEEAAARRNAEAMLDVQTERDRRWYDEHLGNLSSRQYSEFIKTTYGFDPNV